MFYIVVNYYGINDAKLPLSLAYQWFRAMTDNVRPRDRSQRVIRRVAFRRRATVQLIVAHRVVQVDQENRLGVHLLTVVRRRRRRVRVVFRAGQIVVVVVVVVGLRLEVRPVFDDVQLILDSFKTEKLFQKDNTVCWYSQIYIIRSVHNV